MASVKTHPVMKVKCSGSCGFVFHADCIKGDIETKKTISYCAKNSGLCYSQNSVKSAFASSSVLNKEF